MPSLESFFDQTLDENSNRFRVTVSRERVICVAVWFYHDLTLNPISQRPNASYQPKCFSDTCPSVIGSHDRHDRITLLTEQIRAKWFGRDHWPWLRIS
jgi:hypothetical protein